MKISNREIGTHVRPYIIAELSANHGGSAQEGYKLLQAAADCGADACKIQCYTADSLTFRGSGDEFVVKTGPWKGRSLHDLYQEAETPPELVKDLFEYAKKHKIRLFSSVFDFAGVDLMVNLGSPAIKIASFELVDLPLIQYAAKTGLPMIISTGMGSRSEIIDAINGYFQFSTNMDGLALLHCISNYPAYPKEADIPALGPLSNLLGARHVVGFSDHTLGFGSASAAVAFGACIIEKHFIIDRNQGGPDSSFSMEPAEFDQLVRICRETWEAIQPASPAKGQQHKNLLYRKSLFVTRDVSCGDSFSDKNVGVLRPAHGLQPKFYHAVLAGVATQDLKAGTPLQRQMVSTLS